MTSDPFDWDTPHKEKPTGRVSALLWVLVEIPYLLAMFMREKWFALTASRQDAELHFAHTARELDFLARSDRLTEHEKEKAKEALENLEKGMEQVNMESKHVDRHVEGAEDKS